MLLLVSGILAASGTTIRITSPKAGARVSGMLDVRASVKADAGIGYVILAVDDDRPCASNSAPYGFEVDTRELTDGPHALCVEVYDRYGLVGSSKAITVYVKNGSSSAVEVKTEAPASRVASRPAPTPPVRTASGASSETARAVASAAGSGGTAAMSPALAGRGPLPAPTHSPDGSMPAVPRPGLPETGSAAMVASGTLSSSPAQPAPVRTGARGHTVVLNGRPVAFDVAPYVDEGRLHVGFRAMMESIGAEVTWAAATRTATGVKGTLRFDVPVGERCARVNGAEVAMTMPAVIRESRTMLPVRALAHAVGSAISWDGGTRTATLHTKQHALAKHQPAD
jgi:hypothetical protein